MSYKIITNNVPREVIHEWQLTRVEQADFDYIDWQACERGEDSASFVRYLGQLYDLGDTEGRPPAHSELAGWHTYISDSFFSGVVFRYCEDYEQVVCGRYYT